MARHLPRWCQRELIATDTCCARISLLCIPCAKHMCGTSGQTDCSWVHSWDFSDPCFIPDSCFSMLSSLQRTRFGSHNGKTSKLNSNNRLSFFFFLWDLFWESNHKDIQKGRKKILSCIMRPWIHGRCHAAKCWRRWPCNECQKYRESWKAALQGRI